MQQSEKQEINAEIDLVEQIKFAKPEDVTQVVAFGYKSFAENGLEGLSVEPDFNKTLINITNWVIDDVVLVKRNDENEKHIDGCLAMTLQSPWWSNEEYLFGTLLYIKPEKRSYKLARALLKAGQEYAIMNDIPLVIDLFAEKDVERKKKMLRFLGFKELGSLFIFKPDEE